MPDFSQPFRRQFSQAKDMAGRLGRARDAFFDPNAMKAAVKEIASGRGGQDIRSGGWRRRRK